MSTRQLVIEIEAGDKMCASDLEVFCYWFRQRFGNEPYCLLFDEYGILTEKDGCIKRHPDCIAAEAKARKKDE